MTYMTTFTGEDFDAINPDIDKIKIQDIAHALSLICRGNGHLKQFYSVAMHSINCAKEAKARNFCTKTQLICLLHDASEAYIADIIRPVKPHLANYYELEEKLQSLVYKKFVKTPISDSEMQKMKQIDDEVLAFEFEKLMNRNTIVQKGEICGELSLECSDFKAVETEFICLFKELSALISYTLPIQNI